MRQGNAITLPRHGREIRDDGHRILARRLAQAGEAAYQAEFTEGAVVRRYLDYFEAVRS